MQPSPVPRYCGAYPCGQTVTVGTYCPAHQQHKRRHYTGTPYVNYGRRWRRFRTLFLAAHPYCVDCGSATDLQVDHEIPHEGDSDAFWDVTNWTTRCLPCHSRKTAREQTGGGGSR